MDSNATPNHRWDYCSMCGPTVICGKCGNNCCNGGYGMDGKCDACPSAYAKQDAEWEQHKHDTDPSC